MEVKNVKGTHDIIGEEANAFIAVENLMRQVCDVFAFNEVRPPVLEHSELFTRSVGESSDVVRKEMYTFLDKSERSLTLRPEFTAGIIRLIVQNKLLATNELPLKCYYNGPVFRYERPQLGRYRQFNQFGVESVGCNNPLNDIEVITLAYTILQSLSLENVTIKINTLGDEESRQAYKDALRNFFAEHIENMCPDCKSRFELNPLRILDCKVPEDQEIVKGAPKMSNFLSEAAREKFDLILNTLQAMDIPYEIDDTLVRGLDYYSDVVFEFHYTSKQGNNYGAIGAGGHYDRLVKELGGPDLPGVGFSFGVERIVSVLKDDGLLPDVGQSVDAYVMTMGEAAQVVGMQAANALRMYGVITDYCFDSVKLGIMFKRAEKKNAKVAVIIGENEVNNNKVIIKNMATKEQNEVDCDNMVDEVIHILQELEHEHDDCCCGHHEHEEGCCCGHHHDEECHCHHEGKCGECGHQPGEFPCHDTGICPCGENPFECDCNLTGICKCHHKEK